MDFQKALSELSGFSKFRIPNPVRKRRSDKFINVKSENLRSRSRIEVSKRENLKRISEKNQKKASNFLIKLL